MSHMSYFNGTGNLINKLTNELGAFPPSLSLFLIHSVTLLFIIKFKVILN